MPNGRPKKIDLTAGALVRGLGAKLGAPPAHPALEPFRAAGVLAPDAGWYAAEYAPLAGSVGDDDLEDIVHAVGWDVGWRLDFRQRLFQGRRLNLCVRDALLDEAVRRGMLRVTPEGPLLTSTPGEAVITLRPLSRSPRAGEWRDLDRHLRARFAPGKAFPGLAEIACDVDLLWHPARFLDAEQLARYKPAERRLIENAAAAAEAGPPLHGPRAGGDGGGAGADGDGDAAAVTSEHYYVDLALRLHRVLVRFTDVAAEAAAQP